MIAAAERVENGLPPGRRGGLLLHLTSLPGRFGIGDAGPAAHRFADFLAAAGQRVWQLLPLGPTGYGDSPYQALSAFAGNPLLVSPEALADDGLFSEQELDGAPRSSDSAVDYAAVARWKGALLAEAAARFRTRAAPALRRELEAFRADRADWLEDFVLFLALKERHQGAPWTAWEPPLAARDPRALARARDELRPAADAHAFAQFAFDRQWRALRRACAERGILLVGDLPIYVAHDSAEVWSRRELFCLDAHGEPLLVAGVPPDYFSATGQRWGNPVYRWEDRPAECHAFFAERVRATLDQVDVVRVDHFRGLEAYWAVPGDAPTAEHGEWRPGPGEALFEALQTALGRLPFIAENLGVITPEVEALRRRYRLPGMAVLQFAFGTDPQAHTFLPHAYERDLVAYTGTHDNDTVLGWAHGAEGDSTRSREDVRREREAAARYLAVPERELGWSMIRAVTASVADTAVVPLQDALGLDSEGRMNRPGSASGNWRWRFADGALTPALAGRLAELAALYGRTGETP